MKRIQACIVAVLAAIGSVNAPAQDHAGIDELRSGLIDSFSKGDIDRMLTFLAPDVVVTWQNGEVSKGPEEVLAYYNRMMKGDKPIVKSVSAKPEILGRHLYDDWAVSWGNLHDQFVLTDGTDLPLNSTFTITTAKRGDRWLVTGYHASVNAFENPVLAVAVKKVAMWTLTIGTVVGIVLGFVLARVLRRRTT